MRKILVLLRTCTDNTPFTSVNIKNLPRCPRSTPQILPRCPRFGSEKYGIALVIIIYISYINCQNIIRNLMLVI